MPHFEEVQINPASFGPPSQVRRSPTQSHPQAFSGYRIRSKTIVACIRSPPPIPLLPEAAVEIV